ncbi:MAG: hypothetical protein ACE5EQ_08800 [Phycisphaerae bacterium]
MALKDVPAIPTVYRGIRMHSRLVAEVAEWIDAVGWEEWDYEPESYLLNGKHYWPDFYVKDADLFIEAKGRKEYLEQQHDCYVALCRETHKRVLVLCPKYVRLYQWHDVAEDVCYGNSFAFLVCPKCGLPNVFMTHSFFWNCNAGCDYDWQNGSYDNFYDARNRARAEAGGDDG